MTLEPTSTSTSTTTPTNTPEPTPTATPEVKFGEGNFCIIGRNFKGQNIEYEEEPEESITEYVDLLTLEIWQNATTRLMVNNNGELSELPWDARVVINTTDGVVIGYPCVIGKLLPDTENAEAMYVPYIFPANGGMVVATDTLQFEQLSMTQKKTII